MFLAFFILNVPLLYFYSKGITSAQKGEDVPMSQQITSKLFYLTIGNLGESGYACANFNYATNAHTLRFNCPYGTMREMTALGLQKIDN